MGNNKNVQRETDEGVVMDTESDDEGEVLVLKIQRLRQSLESQKQDLASQTKELSSYEEQLKASTPRPRAADSDRQEKVAPAAGGDGKAGATPRKNSLSDGLDAYELLEEKHRLSGAFLSNQTASTEGTFSTTTSDNTTASDAIFTDSRDINDRLQNSENYVTSKLGKSSFFASNTAAGRSPVLASDDEAAVNSTERLRDDGHRRPGAVSVAGFTSSEDGSSAQLSTTDIEEAIDEEIALHQANNIDMLIEANLVDDADGTSAGPLVSAKRDPWYRRNQWWLAGALVLIVVAIILSIVLTTVDLNPAPAPTMAPTTEVEGMEADTKAVVVASFASAVSSLANETSPQSEALRWVSERRFANPSDLTSDVRILQQYALAALFMSTLGQATWTHTDGWMNATDECTWYGVECQALDQDGSSDMVVVGLVLPSNNISGSIPSDLAMLSTSLLHLDLSMNQLMGPIPSEIGLLSALATIDFNSNGLGGNIPSSISTISALRHIDVSSNMLTGSIPANIESLTMLQSINVGHNDLTESLPSEIGRLTQLEYLNCESNRLGFAIPSQLGLLSKLEVFHGGSNDFIGTLFSELGPFQNLLSLDLSSNLISGSIPYQITLLSSLASLDLSYNLMSGTMPVDIGLLRRLTSLNVRDNSLVNLLPPSIGFLQNMTHLDVNDNEIDEVLTTYVFVGPEQGRASRDVPWPELSRLTNLITLEIGGMPIQGYSDELLQLTNLEILSLSTSNLEHPQSPRDVSLLSSLSVLTTLKELDLSNTNIGGSSIPKELSFLTNLEVLNLHGNSLRGSLETMLGLLSKLKVLDLQGHILSGTLPSEIFNLSHLTHLNLAGKRYSYGDPVGSIPSTIGQLTKLRRLDLKLGLFTGSIPSEIGLTQLEDLNLRETAINGTIPIELLALTSLRSVDIGSTDVSGPIPEFNSQFENLKSLDLSSTFLSGSIPSGLWSLSMLTDLTISNSNGVYGRIPSDVGNLSSLTRLDLNGVNLTNSTLPSTIGLLRKLESLDLCGTSLNGTIPPEVFYLAQLANLNMGGNDFSGSLPTEIGLGTNLLDLQIANVPIQGVIPTEIGNLLLLKTLDLSNTDISGSIISELTGRLVLLQDLNLDSTQISGPLPPEISNLLSLRTLSLAHTSITGTIPSEMSNLISLYSLSFAHTALTGTIPSEMAMLVSLNSLDVSIASLTGTFPAEMATMTFLAWMDLSGNDITGSIPDERCGFHFFSLPNGSSQAVDRIVFIDCAEVECTCCQCFPTAAPSLSPLPSASPSSPYPSFSPSTPQPSLSIVPSDAPTDSIAPSTSIMPSNSRICLPFTSIADIGTTIFDSWDKNEDLILVDLPFPFPWRGQTEYSTITASPNGVIYLGNVDSCGISCGKFEDCCEAFPVGQFADFGLPRVALGQTDLEFSGGDPIPANAYYALVGDAFIISYEGARFHPPSDDTRENLYFQVALYPDGNIEMRWGQGFPEEDRNVAAGLEDHEIAIPATGEPFDHRGVTAFGTWPTNQCRTFIVTSEGNYTEYEPPSVAPSTSPAPSTSDNPTMDSACESFSPIGAIGNPVEFPYSFARAVSLSLPFAFKWRGESSGSEYSSVTVSRHGAIFLGDMADCPEWCQYDKVTCCEAFPIGDLSGSRIPRIALAQQDLKGSRYFYATVGDAFIISFEGVDFASAANDGPLNLYFQVALYADGKIELRWGQGVTRYHENVAAGLEDIDLAVPVTGGPFGPRGVTEFGEAWPTGQCRMYIPTVDGNYTEHF